MTVKVWTVFKWLKVGSCEHGNDLSGFIGGGKFFDQPSGYHLV
jgi:hypothetical protein